ncbi:MAG: aminopeptidase N, partial [Desulfobulbaceae bacterium]|nr:aminopeptidase N [Desulfobulbaceae bacterium]
MTTKKTIFLKDYTPPPYLVDSVDLRFELDPASTQVTATLQMRAGVANPGPLALAGEQLELLSVHLDGASLSEDTYDYTDGELRIAQVPQQFELRITNRINPEANTALEGLYRSSGNYCTQCEAEGFRRITCYPDRPDVMAVFTTTIIGGRTDCPVMLSNGNLVEEGELDDGRHFVRWHDPFKKPSYLFALVAGNLVCIEDDFTTMSGRKVGLYIYVEERNREKCGHAMDSLKKAMRWDEESFGREYDLDRYMIVAVDDFNMGAMENKGLNVFNSKYVLARPQTATDMEYEGIEGVIGHEYFHNWTGNRITCRDWFQLSLKEGLTVFRDQEFTADMTTRPVKRIHDVNVIRSFQFREDAGPMAHSVRPDSFVEINNFYTLTVYNKGAEVIRMIHTLVGADGFRKGMDLYFQRHDGQAVTCDDFVRAMEDGCDYDLSRFKRWYAQAGTPELAISSRYDAGDKKFVLTIKQDCPPTPGQEQKKPFFMPVTVGLLDQDGKTFLEETLIFKDQEQKFVFDDIDREPVCSMLRNFSAPVKIKMERSDQDLAFLMAHDSDPFNRWDAGQQLAMKVVLAGITSFQQGQEFTVSKEFHQAFEKLLTDEQSDPAFLALALVLPSENWIAQQMTTVDPEAIFYIRQAFRYQLSWEHRDIFFEKYHLLGTEGEYHYTAVEAGRRSLRNVMLGYLLVPDAEGEVGEELLELGEEQYQNSDNMTEVAAALGSVVNADRERGDTLLEDFYRKWQSDPLVVDKWLTLQATCSLPGTLERVQALTGHPAFSLKNPNQVRALIGAFCSTNP